MRGNNRLHGFTYMKCSEQGQILTGGWDRSAKGWAFLLSDGNVLKLVLMLLQNYETHLIVHCQGVNFMA